MSKLNLDRASRLAIALVDSIATTEAGSLATLKQAAIEAATAKSGKDAANTESKDAGAKLWPLVRDVARMVDESEQAGELDTEQVQACFKAVVMDALEGEQAAIATCRTYTSTASKCIAAVRSRSVKGWPVLVESYDAGNPEAEAEPIGHDGVRELLKSDEATRISGMVSDIGKMVRKIGGRENCKTRSFASRLAALEAIVEAVTPAYEAAVKADDAPKDKDKSPSELLKQRAPSVPMQTEVSQAA